MSDICLLLEGTFPYVSGGVSTWVYNLINSLPNFTFSVVVISPYKDSARKYKYPIPDNVVAIKEIYLHEYSDKNFTIKKSRKRWEKLLDFYNDLWEGNIGNFENICELFLDDDTRCFSWKDYFFSKNSFGMLLDFYKRHEKEHSFIDYFWTWRFTHLPLFNILTNKIPECRVYHSVSTGYAGLMGALSKIYHKKPFLITEHGIYTNERKIEITTADWIYTDETQNFFVQLKLPFFKQWWTNLFSFMSKTAYKYADEIITLYTGNQQLQIEDGAPVEKLSIIPNGINLDKFNNLSPCLKKNEGFFYIGFVGRVVSIKDVKTFIKSINIVYNSLKNIKILILGPTEEEPEYFKECELLIKMLGLNDIIEFTGKINVLQYYPILDIVVLTSVSEAQPLVLLEANCLGIPCVASDVGACDELLNGRTDNDKKLGPSGLVTPVVSPEKTAEAIIKILTNKKLYNKMSKTGVTRVNKYYDEKLLNFKYYDLYREYINLGIGE